MLAFFSRGETSVYRWTILGTLLLISSQSHAGGWELFGKQEKLKGYVIAEVGEISELRPPIGESWNVDLYSLNSRCFAVAGYANLSPYGEEAGLLLVRDSSDISVAIFRTSINSIKVEVYPVNIYECPYGTSPEESIELMRQNIESQRERLELQQKELQELLNERRE